MKFRPVIAILAVLVATSLAMEQPSFHTKGSPTGKPTGPLRPGEYWWKSRLSPRGPVVVLVSLPQQTMNVYRNGILIGRSSISSGGKGNSTPPGVFNILEKKQTHYSKTYHNAPMPNMQSTDPTNATPIRDYNFGTASVFQIIHDAKLDPWSAPQRF
jgi:hypothetical protein